MQIKKRQKMHWIVLGILWFCVVGMSTPVQAAIDTEGLAGRIASSLQQLSGPHYKTIAISRIKRRNSTTIDINELIDFTNVKIVQGRRFRVTDRTKLQLILKEQRIQLAESVSPNEYKELGQILGVQLFVYGTLYNDALVLKAIDVQNSAIAWADVFPLIENGKNHVLLTELSQRLVDSLRNEATRLRNDKITKISFWNLDAEKMFLPEQIMDYITSAISKSQLLTVIDRENLSLISQEQQLNQSIFIDESQARRLGELYGVDAFLYGNITRKESDTYLGSLKIMSIFTGVIEWADLIRFNVPRPPEKLINPFEKKIKERQRQKRPALGMAQINGGTFAMGSDDPEYNSGPVRNVRIKTFWLDLHEVSNAKYNEFIRAKNHRFPTRWVNGTFPASESDLPVVGVSWEDAKMFCEFRKKRLPTEAEWEFAFRGLNGQKYPWGRTFSPSFTVTFESGLPGAVSVNSPNRDVTPEGIRHLAGNVREFVEDDYRPYTGSGLGIATDKVVRGSSWAHGAYEASGYFRGHTRPNMAWPDIGFRCARDSQ